MLSIQKNPSAVDVFDPAAIPAEFQEVITEIKINRTAIKDAISAGREIPGARMVNVTRLSIR